MKLDELKNDKVGVCVSGGLDSKTIAKTLIDAGVDVLCFCADLGQPDEDDINNVVERMSPCGAETVIVDLRDRMAEGCFDVLTAQAMYDGGYWNTTGIARAVTVPGLIPELESRGCTVLSHGATGRGNDQVRFERYTNVLAPDMKVYAPWRDPEILKQFPGRKEMADYLNAAGIKAFPGGRKKYSMDANLAGISYEAEELESLQTPSTIVEPQMGCWPEQAPDKPEKITVEFDKGRAIKIDGKKVAPLGAMQVANEKAGRNGIGITNARENRIVGTKSRGVYEAPGMALLGFCLLQVYQATLDRRATQLFKTLSNLVADQIYDGRYFDPMTNAAAAGIGALAQHASGVVALELYKGNMHFQSLTGCSASLYNETDSSMEASDGLNPESSQGFVDVQSVEARSMAKAGQIRSQR